jgi:hypothetical protein
LSVSRFRWRGSEGEGETVEGTAMTHEMTRLMWEFVIVLVDALEIVAVVLPALGLCTCVVLWIREANRMNSRRQDSNLRPVAAATALIQADGELTLRSS